MLSPLYSLATFAFSAAAPDPPPAATARAQAGDGSVELNPTTRGLPGGEAMQTLIDWLGQYGLMIALAALILGGALFGWAKFGGGGRMSFNASMLAIGGVVGALLVGLAPSLINTFYDLGN